jgi:hypothetical protein
MEDDLEQLEKVFGKVSRVDAQYEVRASAKIYPKLIKLFIPKVPYTKRLPYMEPTIDELDNLVEDWTTRVLTSEQQQEDNEARSIRRTKTLISDYTLCNEFDLFATFTFSPEKSDRFNPDAVKLQMANWLRNQRNRTGKFPYLIVPEFHKDGKALHFHAPFKDYKGELEDAGRTHKGRQLYHFKSYTLGTSQLDLILKNPFYMGQMRIRGKLYPHKYERLISEKLFENAEAVRKRYAIKPTIYAGLPYAYRGLIACGECGCRITFEKKKGKYVYGHCTQYRKKHKATYLPEDEFTKQLKQVFEAIVMPEDAFQELTTAIEQERAQAMSQRDEAVARLDAEIEKYGKRIERIYDDYLEDLITKETYERKHAEFQKSQRKLNQERMTFELDQNKRFDAAQHLLQLSRHAPKIFEKASFEQKRMLLNMVLSNLELHADLLRWVLKKPYDIMAFCHETGNWLGKLFLFQTFEELDSIKDKEAEIQQIHQLLDNDQQEATTC